MSEHPETHRWNYEKQVIADRDFWKRHEPEGYTLAAFTDRTSVSFHEIVDGKILDTVHFTGAEADIYIAKCDRIEELEAELKYWHNIDSLDETREAVEQLAAVRDILDETEEINPSNYDHELVCQMNDAFIEIHGAVNKDKGEGGG